MTLSVPPCPTPSPQPNPAAEADAAAALASLRALLICQQRELGARLDHLPVESGAISIAVAAPMASGLPPFGALTWHGPLGSRPVSPAEALEMILQQLGRDHGAQGTALARKTRASCARIATLVAARQAAPRRFSDRRTGGDRRPLDASLPQDPVRHDPARGTGNDPGLARRAAPSRAVGTAADAAGHRA